MMNIIHSVKRISWGSFGVRMSQADKERSHRKIVEGAARLLRERGVDATSVSDVMTGAGMTHGGFYRHFPTKDALVAASLDEGFVQLMSRFGAWRETGDAVAAARAFEALYTSDAHIAAPGEGCPIAALGGDVARASADLKVVFGSGVRRVISQLSDGKAGARDERQADAARRLAMLAGAVMIARASDRQTAELVMSACRQALDCA